MDRQFPPLLLRQPTIRVRRGEQPRRPPLAPEILARRSAIAEALKITVTALDQRLRRLSEDERKAIFYKLEHEPQFNPTTSLGGTGLKAVARPTSRTTLAVPSDSNLKRLEEKIEQFGSGPMNQSHTGQDWVAAIQNIVEADPKERLSPALRRKYAALVSREWIICEIEMISLLQGRRQQERELNEWLQELEQLFGRGVHGNCFEYEIVHPVCRAVIRCTGATFKTLVESATWIARIRAIEPKPKFQTFHETVERFQMQRLGPIPSPPETAPTICVVDSGVTAGNPFLAKVVKDDLITSFLVGAPGNPNDEYGHGSAVASLAAYYQLNIAEGANNVPQVWIASARILNAANELEEPTLFSKLLKSVVEHYAPLGVRIFCLAVGDSNKSWSTPNREIIPKTSWVARRLDALSRKHDVVFVTCTGNLLTVDVTEFVQSGSNYPDYLQHEETKILDPGQSALSLTVGSIVSSVRIDNSLHIQPMAQRHEASPFTRCGPGIQRETKPELVEYGGNYAWDGTLNRAVINTGLRLAVASNKLTPALVFQEGTSFAAR